MITSFIPGRIRFRHQGLKNNAVMAAFTAKMHDLPGFENLTSNLLTGSVTVHYTPASNTKTAQALWLRDVLPQFASRLPVRNRAAGRSACRTRGYYRLMTLTLLLCFASPSFGFISLHRYSAFALAALLGRHMYDYRKRIF